MAIRITYKNKTQSVRDWANELDIPISRIYSRLRLCWPPELVLSKKRFHFCNNYLAAKRMEQYNNYPTNYYEAKVTNCCTKNSICSWAIPLTPWSEIEDDPSKGNYYCSYNSNYNGEFLRGDNPIC